MKPGWPNQLAEYKTFIAYRAIENEADPRTAAPNYLHGVYVIPPHASRNPREAAREIRTWVGNEPVCLLIPGRVFDCSGTRNGRGGGWYDRFLSTVPAAWIRIGVCRADQLSAAPLPRAAWDEPVDWVAVAGTQITFYKTNARGIVAP